MGNADGDFQRTKIAFKSGEQVHDTLAKDLEAKYKIGSECGMEEASDYDVAITLGAE